MGGFLDLVMTRLANGIGHIDVAIRDHARLLLRADRRRGGEGEQDKQKTPHHR